MGEGRYVISQVVEKTDIKAHTIRYWEEELELTIDRNNMGHRYYSDENIKLFLKIKELKELGYQLKAIKMLLPDIKKLDEMDEQGILKLKDELNMKAMQQVIGNHEENVHNKEKIKSEVVEQPPTEVIVNEPLSNVVSSSAVPDKMVQFQEIVKRIVLDAMRENNEEMCNSITESVTENVIKEMDYLFRVKEDREEERFKKLDETIRGVQKSRQEVAASGNKKKKRHFFRKS